MRNLATDFDLTVLWPLIAVALFALWQSARMLISSANALRHTEKHFDDQVRTGAVGTDVIELLNENRRTKSQSGRLLKGSIAALFLLTSVMLISDRWKLSIAYIAWTALWVASTISFLVAIPMACTMQRNRIGRNSACAYWRYCWQLLAQSTPFTSK
jgi:hypothetical protein